MIISLCLQYRSPTLRVAPQRPWGHLARTSGEEQGIAGWENVTRDSDSPGPRMAQLQAVGSTCLPATGAASGSSLQQLILEQT